MQLLSFIKRLVVGSVNYSRNNTFGIRSRHFYVCNSRSGTGKSQNTKLVVLFVSVCVSQKTAELRHPRVSTEREFKLKMTILILELSEIRPDKGTKIHRNTCFLNTVLIKSPPQFIYFNKAY